MMRSILPRRGTGLALSGLLLVAGCGSPGAGEATAGVAAADVAGPAAGPPPPTPSPTAVAAPAPTAAPADRLPSDVVTFKTRRDACDHFRGEASDDETRAAEIAREAERTCTGTDAALKRLRQRYAGEPAVIAALAAYEDEVE